MGRAIWILGVFATVLLLAAALGGYGIEGVGKRLEIHLLAGLAAALLLLFSQGWIFLYLLGVGRVLRRSVGDLGLDPGEVEAACRAGRRALPWALGAAVAVAAVVVSGVAAAGSPEGAAGLAHHVAAYLAATVQAAALAVEKRVLAEHEERFTRLAAAC